jgi:AraC family transcriptional regulator
LIERAISMGEIPIAVVQECLDKIEANLAEPISVEALARRSGYSLWHFQRLFQALVGETVGSYVRKRRLSESSHRLLRTSEKIADIALQYQFQSHEAYTRAFKKQFTLSPAQYRRLREDRATRPKRLSERDLAHLDQRMQPEIVIHRAFRMVGFARRFNRIRSDHYDGSQLKRLWHRFFRSQHRVRNAVDNTALGVVIPLPIGEPCHDTQATYVAGAQVSDTEGNPHAFEHVQLAPRRYALFNHFGPLTNLRSTMDSIFAVWLVGNATYGTEDAPMVEIYTERFQPDRDDSVMTIAVPVITR